MQRKDGLIPVAEALADLPGPVQALRDASPQARHHFTVADQVDQLVWASEADPERAFMARMMALCSLPRSNPGKRTQYVRRNGPYTLVMSATGLNKLPFGNLPRLLMAWICNEAVKTGSRELVLGKSLSEFMRSVGIYSSSSEKHTRLRNQMKRLFNASVRLIYQDSQGEVSVSSAVADRTAFWWNDRKPDERTLWENNTLHALKRSSLGLDLYLWLVYRTFPLRAPQPITWKQVYRQFGLHPAKASDKRTVQNFRSEVLRELKKIKLAWPDLNYATAPGVLILLPSTPAIAPSSDPPRLKD